MVFVELLSGHKYVAFSTAGLEAFTFLQNHNIFPRVAVHEVNPYFGVMCCLDPAALDRAMHLPRRLLGGYLIELGVFWRRGIILLGTPSNPVLVLVVCHQ